MLVGLGIAGLGGLFILWLQLGTLTSIASLALGSRSLQTSLQSAAAQISEGDFDGAQADVAAMVSAADRIQASTGGAHITVIGAIPGLGTATENWDRLAIASSDIAVAVDDMLAVFGEFSGKSGGKQLFSDGAIDIEMLRALPPRVDAIDAGIRDAVLQLGAIDTSGPAAGPLDQVRDRALNEVEPVQEAMNAIVDLAPELPDALGANGVRRYLVAIGNQAEMRASGGAPLTLVMVEFDNGRITIPIKGQTSTQLFPPLNAPVSWWGPGGNPFFPGNPRFDPMVVTNTHPNLLYSGREMAGAWAGGGYPQVDGVALIDLTAISAVLDATGPIESPAYGSVNGDQLGQILLIDAYAQFGQAEAEARQAANQELVDSLLTRILSGSDLVSVARAIAGTAPGRHFQVWLRDPDFENLAVRAGFAGTVFDPAVGDWSAMYTQNGNQSKVDVFQQRNTLVTVQLAEDGSARVTQQLTLTNATPPDRPALGTFGKIGYETMWLKSAYLMYVPNAATAYRVQYPDGFAVRSFRNHQQFGRGFVDDGFGQKLVRVVGWTPPGGQSAVSVSYELPAGTFLVDGDLAYRLRVEPQATFNDPTVTVRVTAPAGWRPVQDAGMQVTGGTAEVSAIVDRPVDVRIGFERGA